MGDSAFDKVKNDQMSSIFFERMTGFSVLIFFLPKVTKSTPQLWSYGSLWNLQNSREQCLHAKPSMPVFLLHLVHFPFGSSSFCSTTYSGRFKEEGSA